MLMVGGGAGMGGGGCSGGSNHLFRRIIVSIQGHGKWFLKNCFSFSWSEEIICSHWIEFGKFSSQFMENISDLTECNVLLNNEHLILIWFFSWIDTEFDLKITLRTFVFYACLFAQRYIVCVQGSTGQVRTANDKTRQRKTDRTQTRSNKRNTRKNRKANRQA